MRRQDMIDTMRAMGWRPVGFKRAWVGMQHRNTHLIYRLRQGHCVWSDDDHPMREHEVMGQIGSLGRHSVLPSGRWSNLCDDEVLRFYLKIMMEGL